MHHLIGSAAGWGGLPDAEATYVGFSPGLPVGEYELTVGADVPVDGFWSISVYNAEGYFEPNERDAYSVNSITAARNDDGSVTVRFGGDGDPTQLAADHRRLELPGPPVPPAAGDPQRGVDLPRTRHVTRGAAQHSTGPIHSQRRTRRA